MTNDPVSTPEKVTEPLPKTERRDFVCLILFFAFAFFAANCLYVGGTRLGFAIGAAALLFTALFYLRGSLRPSFIGILHLAASLLILCSFALYEVNAFSPLKMLFFGYTVSVFLVFCCGLRVPTEDFRILLSPFYLFFGITCRALPMTAKSVASTKSGNTWKTVGKVLLALLVSLPLLLFLLILLIFADIAFETALSEIDFDIGEWVVTAVLGGILVFCLFPLAFAIRKKRVKLEGGKAKPFLSILDATFTNTVLIAVDLLYLAFLLSQITYLTGGFSGDLAGYTFSDYARRGFFEMCIIAVTNLCILGGASLFIKRGENGRLPLLTRISSTFISLFSIFLVVSAIAKMLLYIRTYGLTFLRLGTSIFMLLLFFVFTAITVKTFAPRFKAMRMVLATAGILVALTAIAEPYNVIAKYNLYAYQSGMHDEYELDTNYLAYHCGDHGVHALIELSADDNAFVANRAKEQLDKMHNGYYYRANDLDLREMTLTRYQARASLAKYYAK